jgi:hypothetical protein
MQSVQMGKRIENQAKPRRAVDPPVGHFILAFDNAQFSDDCGNMWRSLNHFVNVFAAEWACVIGIKLDAVKEVETTGWKPGAADEGARLESIFAVMKMVDYHVYHLRSHTSVCGSAISLVFRKAVLDVEVHNKVYRGAESRAAINLYQYIQVKGIVRSS